MEDLIRRSCLVWLLSYCSTMAFAHHGKGGVISYVYLGAGSTAGTSQYKVVIQHYVNCERISDEPSQVYLGVFDGASSSLVTTVTITQTSKTEVTKQSFSPCISPDPTVCYYLVLYTTTLTLTDNTGGYVLAEQDCCRADEIVNISNPSSTGFTNVNTIPGVINGVVYRNNSSPTLVFRDTAVICYNAPFTIDFGATDADGDVLSYSFCSAKGTGSSSRQPNPPSSPPYADVTYASGYSGSTPLGSGVTIDATTGLISGTAPGTPGDYAITVCIAEYRNGVLIGSTKKEVLVTVANCSLSAATLKTAYVNCDNYTFTFSNENSAQTITSYYWDFGVPGITTDTSTLATPAYTYADTGTYTLKLKVSNSTGCTDSTTSPVKVYPGFTPAFTVTGSCYQSPFLFTDATYAKYGTVDSWSWNFGESSSASNTSVVQDPTHQYASANTYTVTLNVGTSKGCSGSISKAVTANDKPLITLPFTDTLICSIDSLPLIAEASGSGASYSWSPAYNIINAGSANPIVYPKDTTVYTVTVTQNGCVGTDSITVNVLDFITVSLPADTTMCLSDSIQLRPVSYALKYAWSPGTALSDSTIKYPNAAPSGDITYLVTANLGKCQDKASIHVKVFPYPKAYAGVDTTICWGSTAQLTGTTDADRYTWSPDSSLLNSSSLRPVADPLITTPYLLTVQNAQGCLKPVQDTVVVTVIPKVVVFAGNDTAVVAGEPLQLHAVSTDSALVSYTWTPGDWLDNAFIYNPVATITSDAVDSIVYLATAVTPQGCTGSDALTVKVYKTGPTIFMANAFTPDGDGHNDLFRPILVGIARLNFFRVYNRWGQLVYSTTEAEKGWDGLLRGMKQESGTYVYMVQGVDYLGRAHFKKGTFILIR
ncbi:MAG TPA: PKD domain-containing protein [Puia sp.]|nr:PKD domain-containing protein [Puia sp.]